VCGCTNIVTSKCLGFGRFIEYFVELMIFSAVNPSKLGKEKEVGVVHCRIPRPPAEEPASTCTVTTDLRAEGIADSESSNTAKKASDSISDEVFLEGVDSSCRDSSESRSIISNTCAAKDSNPATGTDGAGEEASKDQTFSPDTQSLVESKEYPGLKLFNQYEEREIEHSTEEQYLEMKDMDLSLTIPPKAILKQESVVRLTVAPAVHGNIQVPVGCRPHSPLYMMSPCKLAKDAKITVGHTCLIEDEEDGSNMVVLVPVDLAEAQTSGVYTLKEMDVEKKFEKGSQKGEIKMRHLQPFRVAKKVSLSAEKRLDGKFTAERCADNKTL